jgi:chorismate mutase/prephenate dehydratase
MIKKRTIAKIKTIRKEIDTIDRIISQKIIERFKKAKEIGKIKKKLSIPLKNERREKEVLTNISRKSKKYRKELIDIYKEIIKKSLRIQR